MQQTAQIDLGRLMLDVGEPGRLWAIVQRDAPGTRCILHGPTFEVDGQERGDFVYVGEVAQRTLPRGGREWTLRYLAAGSPALELRVAVRAYRDSPVLRFRYRLTADSATRLTKHDNRDRIRYCTLHGAGLAAAAFTEVQLSHFDPVAHSYQPSTEERTAGEVQAGLEVVGPIVLQHTEAITAMLAYEHGADHPDGFLQFRVEPGDDRPLALAARKGNYYDGQVLGPETAWESVWFELGLAPVPVDAFLRAYRAFFLDEIAENIESRRPYLFYNTWNYQERNHYFNRRPYLDSMHFERMSAEIDVAHRLGIDVFVIDTGWYVKTGDWLVNTERFPDGLRAIKRKLDAYGMRLGLWFNPTVAARSSDLYRRLPHSQMVHHGQPREVGQVWETEESVSMCLASDYTDDYIDKMVRLHDELGVSYFKWDAISQYGCDSPDHHHGTAANSQDERADCYAYQMGRQMIRIVEEVTRRCPDVIVDFDITEGGRFVGLGFLSVGKYFLMNNGPYFHDFDIPRTVTIEPDTINVFFYPGPARPRVCRQGIKYDTLIPSILFLTHYLPDAPALSQRNSLAALMLGGNGIWGDLLSLSQADVALLREQLVDYKRVAEAVTRAYPRQRGFIGASPEVYEKIDPASASGVIVFFTVTPGTMVHLTQPLDLQRLEGVKGAREWERTPDGRLRVVVDLERDDARVVYVNGTTTSTGG